MQAIEISQFKTLRAKVRAIHEESAREVKSHKTDELGWMGYDETLETKDYPNDNGPFLCTFQKTLPEGETSL